MQSIRFLPLAIALVAFALQSEAATAAWNPFKAIKNEAEKAGRTIGKIGKKIERGAEDFGRDAERGIQDVGQAFKDLNPKVKLRAGARLKGSTRGRGSASLYIAADVRLAGQHFSVDLFNGRVMKTSKSFKVRRTVKKGKVKMTVTLTISWHGNEIQVKPAVKIRKLRLPVPPVRVKV